MAKYFIFKKISICQTHRPFVGIQFLQKNIVIV